MATLELKSGETTFWTLINLQDATLGRNQSRRYLSIQITCIVILLNLMLLKRQFPSQSLWTTNRTPLKTLTFGITTDLQSQSWLPIKGLMTEAMKLFFQETTLIPSSTIIPWLVTTMTLFVTLKVWPSSQQMSSVQQESRVKLLLAMCFEKLMLKSHWTINSLLMITTFTITINLLMCLILNQDKDRQQEELKSFLLEQISKRINLFSANLEIKSYQENTSQIITFNALLLLEKRQELFLSVLLLKKDFGLLGKRHSYTTISPAFQRLNLPVGLSMDILKSLFMERTSLILELEKYNAFSTELFIWMEQWWKTIL